jgi:tetratricopeptide (TPR) repeat protein
MDYARTLAWNDQMDEAEALYAELARTGDAGATKGLARVIGWKGDLERSESTWRQALVIAPTDPEALTGLAQVLSWQGRQSDAESALQSALRANPAYGDARALMRWVQADLRPNVTVAAVNTNDSDHNRATTLSIDYGARAPWSGSLGGRYTGRMANFATTDSRADAVSVFGRWQPAGTTWQIRADGGLTRHSSTFVPTTSKKEMIASGGLRVSGNLGHSLMFGLSGSRAPFDETALLIANGIVNSEVAAEGTVSLPLRFSISAAGSHARLTGGTRENNRKAYSSTLRWTPSRRWSAGVDARRFGYDTPSSDGYFSPRRYTLVEATGRGHVGGNLGWNGDADVGLGNQSIDLFGASTVTRLAERASLVFGYRFDPAHELSATGSYANVAAPGQNTGSEYKWYSMSLRARVGF